MPDVIINSGGLPVTVSHGNGLASERQNPPVPPTSVTVAAGHVPDDGQLRRRRGRQRRGRIGLLFAKVAVVLFDLLGLLVFGGTNVSVLANGLAELAPSVFGAKLSTWPFFGMMAGYRMWNRILVGHLVALGFFVIVAFTYKTVLTDLLKARGNEQFDASEWNVRNTTWFWRVVGIGLTILDGVLFYVGVTQTNMLWVGKPNYFLALLCTAFYLFLAAAFTGASMYLHDWERSE